MASLAFVACDRTYDAPPLNEPKYDGAAANTTISQLREEYKAATQDAPITITKDEVLKAYVSGNDESGNIFKTIYLQDETGGISMLVDQSSVYNYYPVGQEVYVNLKGLCISVYGDEQQIGHPDGYLFRTPWVDFEEHVKANGWAGNDNVKPVVIDDISTLNAQVDAMKFKLVQLEGVRFANGGKATFAPEDGYGNETLTDSHGNTITVRTSNYADFASDELPVGQGTVLGILGRFRGAWQLTIRTKSDVLAFDGTPGGEPTPEPGETVIFNETFGTPEKSGNYWPYFNAYEGFDNPKAMFEDASGKATVRVVNNYTNVWYPTGSDIDVKIKGINAKGATTATLEYAVGANVYNAGEQQDLNTLKVRCNGTELTIPSKVVTGDKKEGNQPNKIAITGLQVSDDTTLEFYTTSATNAYGLRLYSVKLYTGTSSEGGTEIKPTPTE